LNFLVQKQLAHIENKMVVKIKVEGFTEFEKTITEMVKEPKTIFVLFSGSKDSTGQSWCPDCVAGTKVFTVL
jgi:hypothetical protein